MLLFVLIKKDVTTESEKNSEAPFVKLIRKRVGGENELLATSADAGYSLPLLALESNCKNLNTRLSACTHITVEGML